MNLFYMRPRVRLPVVDGRLIPLAGAPFGFLPTPVQTVPQERPHAGRTVANVELRLDELADALERPQLGRVPSGPRALEQQPPQARLLGLRQPGRAARRGPGA